MALRSGSSPRTVDDAHWTPPPLLQSCDRVGKLKGRIWGLGGRSMYRHRGLPAVNELVFANSPPAAAPPNQPFYPDSSRMLCHSRSGPMRAFSPPNHRDRGDRSEYIGTDRSLARIAALHPELCKETTFRSDGPGWSPPVATQRTKTSGARPVDGLPPASLSPQQPFHSFPIPDCTVAG